MIYRIRKQLALLLCAVMATFSLSAQQQKMKASDPLVNFGKAFYEAVYEYRAIDPLVNPENPVVEIKNMVLLLGEDYSQYQSYDGMRNDSLLNSYAGKYLNPFEIIGIVNSHGINGTSDYYLLRNHKNGESINVKHSLTIMPNDMDFSIYNSQFDEEAPRIEWTIHPEKKNIKGIEATKATATYRGREWTAWFTELMPYPEGPWELTGLPGLIIEAYDSKAEHTFSIIQLMPAERDILQRPEKFKKTSREAFRKFRRKVVEADNSKYKTGERSFPKFSNFIEPD